MKIARWIALGLLVGCSSPYQFSKEISNFNTGVNNVSNAYVSGFNNMISDQQTLDDLKFTDARAKLHLASGCNASTLNAGPCGLYGLGEPQPRQPALAQSRPKTLEALKALTDYANALQAVTNAADRTALDSAASQLDSSIKGLIAAVPIPAASAAGAIAGAGFNIVAWLVGQELDWERQETLRRDVNLAAEPVKTVAESLQTPLDAIKATRQQTLFELSSELLKPLGPSYRDYTARLASARQTTKALDQLNQSDPAAVIKALVKAHEALQAAVNNPTQNFGDSVAAASHFAELAKALYDASTSAASPPSKPGS